MKQKSRILALIPARSGSQGLRHKNLQKLNWGEKKSYSEISEKISQNKKSARAVGNACSKNPILIVVPCHRVVSSNGKFGGYKEGLNKKKKLLELEKII